MSSGTFRLLIVVFLAISIIVCIVWVMAPNKYTSDVDNNEYYTNSIDMKFVLIPAGTFMMGSDKNSEEVLDDQIPRHQVNIRKPFYLGVCEVTQRQWKDVMGDNPSKLKDEDNPVERVSWEDVQDFIKRLNQKEGHFRYRLPTEAEWEYAARAGSTSIYYFGNRESQLGDYAWYYTNSGYKPHPIALKRPNAWGLYDMLGNVSEWTRDWYGERYYANSPSADPTGPSSGDARVFRGCSWYNFAWRCRSAARNWLGTGGRNEDLGFRLALSPEGRE